MFGDKAGKKVGKAGKKAAKAHPPTSAPPALPRGQRYYDDVDEATAAAAATSTTIPHQYKDEVDPLIATSDDNHNNAAAAAAASGRQAHLPVIRNYEQDDGILNNVTDASFYRGAAGEQQQQQQSYGFMSQIRGDPTLQPNTGETNSYDTALFGFALHELLDYLRLANMVAAVASIVLLIVTWIFQAISFQIARLVLSAYLAFLSLVLLGVECMTIWHVPRLDLILKENFGLLRHPVGKSFYIYILATLCFGLHGIWELVIGLVYFASATALLYAYIANPEFRRPYEQELEQDDHEEVRTRQVDEESKSVSWSYYSDSISGFMRNQTTTTPSTASEKSSLLGAAAAAAVSHFGQRQRSSKP